MRLIVIFNIVPDAILCLIFQLNLIFIMLKDNFGRTIKNLRISVTQRCNLNCIYCHREGNTGTGKEMSTDEIARITKICADSGISKVKITGGEPMLRKDLPEIIKNISYIPCVSEVSMTTNASIDADWNKLKNMGLKRINMSLDTLDPDKYSKLISSKISVENIILNIKKAREVFGVVKLNMVVMKGINKSEIEDMIEFCGRNKIVLQLIELIDSDKDFFSKYFYDLSEIEREFAKRADKIITRKFMQNRKKYIIGDAEIEVIPPMHNTEFCKNCTRMRITSDGKFKPCLLRDDNLVDFLTPMRAGASDQELRKLFVEAVGRRAPYFCE